jgi:NitT/TauT family transport system substrate-binding protein
MKYLRGVAIPMLRRIGGIRVSLPASFLILIAISAPLQIRLRAEPLTRLRLLMDWYPDPERGGYYCARQKGYYRAAGLDVEIIPGGHNSAPIQRLLTGRLEFLLSTSGDTMIQAAKGLPLVAVAAIMQHDPQAILVHENSPVRRFQDLEGRTITATPGAVWLQYVRKRYGLTRVRESPATQSIASFIHNTNEILQCFVTSEPYFAREAGIKTRSVLIEDEQFKPYRVLVTSRSFLEQHPEAVRGFVSATLRGWKDYLSDPADINRELLRLNPELNPAKMEYSWRALNEGSFVTGNPAKGEIQGAFDGNRLKAEADILKELGLLRQDFDYRSAFDERFGPVKR